MEKVRTRGDADYTRNQAASDRFNESLKRLDDLKNEARARGERALYARSVLKHSLIDCYAKAELSLIFNAQISRERDEIRGRLGSTPGIAAMDGTSIVLQFDVADVGIGSKGNQEAMFVSLIENVNGPDGKITIPSIVRAYLIKDQPEKWLAGSVYFCPAQGIFKSLTGGIHGELGESSDGAGSDAFDGLHPRVVEGTFEVVDSIPEQQSGIGKNLLSIHDVVNEDLIKTVRVSIDSGSVVIWQTGEPFLQFTDMFIGSFDLRSGVAECHRAKDKTSIGYDNAMTTKPQTPEYAAFEGLLGAVLSVPKAKIDRRIAADREEKREPKSAFPASAVPAKHF